MATGRGGNRDGIGGAKHTAKNGRATYFLKRSSKAWRASLWRGGGGAGGLVPLCAYGGGAGSFFTLLRNSSKVQLFFAPLGLIPPGSASSPSTSPPPSN